MKSFLFYRHYFSFFFSPVVGDRVEVRQCIVRDHQPNSRTALASQNLFSRTRVFWWARQRRSDCLVCVICKTQHVVQSAGGDGWRGDGATDEGQSVWMNCIQLRCAPHETADCRAHSFILLQPGETSKTQNTSQNSAPPGRRKEPLLFLFVNYSSTSKKNPLVWGSDRTLLFSSL